MSKEGTLMTVGILTVISPFLGLPVSWLSWILPLLGLVTILIGYLLRNERAAAPSSSYAENPDVVISEILSYDVPSNVA